MRRMSSALSVVVAACVLFVACIGGSEGTSVAPAATPTAMPTETATEAPSAPARATFVIGQTSTATATKTATSESGPVAVVVTGDVLVYALPDRNARSLAMLPPGSSVTVTGRADGSWLAVEGFGWVQSEPGDEFESLDVPEVAVEDWWRVGGPSHAADARTGVAHVDRVIDALLSGDVAAVRELLVVRGIPCTKNPSIGSPPFCPRGSPEETLVEALVEYTCHIGYQDGERIDLVLANFMATRDGSEGPISIYAVWEGPRSDTLPIPSYATHTMAIALASGEGRELEISEAGIESLGLGCGLRAPGWVIGPFDDEPVEYLLAPIVPAPFVAVE